MINIEVQKQVQGTTGSMDIDIKMHIPKGQLTCLYGKSGAGKTSIFRMLSGLLPPDHGKIMVNDQCWLDTDAGITLPVQQRNVGYVFQEYSLFPNFTVRKNIEYALMKQQHSKIITEILEIMELEALQHYYPNQLSGGQQQRVALARALVQHPTLLLLDEPLSALDHDMRATLQRYIRRVHQEYQLTTLIISHDVPEILKMADYVYHIHQGKIKAQGTPIALFDLNTTLQQTKQVIAEIIHLQRTPTKATLTLLIGKNVSTHIVPLDYAKTLSPGDEIQVSLNDLIV